MNASPLAYALKRTRAAYTRCLADGGASITIPVEDVFPILKALAAKESRRAAKKRAQKVADLGPDHPTHDGAADGIPK